MGVLLQDESMRAYDVATIPGLPLRRPRSPEAAAQIVQLVTAHDVHAAAARLARIITADPTAGPAVALAIRKHLLPPGRLRHPDDHRPALALLDHLVRTTPYFYRYIASQKFFRALWAVQRSPAAHPAARLTVRVLLRGWAEDLAVMFRDRLDPPAAFWILAYRREARHTNFPPPLRSRSFVCHVPSADRKPHAPPARILSPDDLSASIRLLDQLASASDTAQRDIWRHACRPLCPMVDTVRDDSSTHSTNSDIASDPPARSSTSSRRRRSTNASTGAPEPAPVEYDFQPPPRKEAPRQDSSVTNGSQSRLNEKMLAVLRRYDNAFGRTDPYEFSPVNKIRTDSGGWSSDPFFEDSERTLTNVASSRASRSTASSVMSVAAIARENARRKLSESQRSLTVSYNADRSSTEIYRDDGSFEGMQIPPLEGEAANSGGAVATVPALTPSTFAQLDVSESTAMLAVDEASDDMYSAIESVGDTVKLPDFGMMAVEQDKGEAADTSMQVDQQIWKIMSEAAAKAENAHKESVRANVMEGQVDEPSLSRQT